MCIGGAGDNKIQCSVRKDKDADIKTIQFIRADVEMYEKPLRLKHRVTTRKGYDTLMTKYIEKLYVRNKLHERLFDIIDI
jgi:hypothetical protein